MLRLIALLLLLAAVPVRADPPPVEVVRAAARDVAVYVRGLGAVQASEAVVVRARVDGVIQRIPYTEGQTVRAGDTLAVIDPRPYRATLLQAQAALAADAATLANAQRDYKRTAALVRTDAASRQQLDTNGATATQISAKVQGDAAAVAAAQLNLDFCTVTAPFDGRVGLRPVDVGTLVHATDTQGVAALAKIMPIAVVFTLPQDLLPRVRQAAGTPGVSALSADGRVLSEGTLLAADNAIDAQSGTIRLKALFANTDGALWPGQFVTARVRLATLHDALAVPSAAVQRGPEGLFVYRVDAGDTAHRVTVEVTQDDGTVAVIAQGLRAGDAVVTLGQSRVVDGQKVASRPAS